MDPASPLSDALRSTIRRFDGFLRRRLGVYDLCDDTDCLLRIRVIPAPHELLLPKAAVARGEPVVEIHLWNEHLPLIPRGGPDLSWALRLQRQFTASLCRLAAQMTADPRLLGARAVIGTTALLSPRGRPGGVRMMEHFGFQVSPYHSPLGRFGEFWENFYAWWIIWTYNIPSLQDRRLIRLQRVEIAMPAEEFLHRYGNKPAAHEP